MNVTVAKVAKGNHPNTIDFGLDDLLSSDEKLRHLGDRHRDIMFNACPGIDLGLGNGFAYTPKLCPLGTAGGDNGVIHYSVFHGSGQRLFQGIFDSVRS